MDYFRSILYIYIMDYLQVEIAADKEKSERTGKTGTSGKAVKFEMLVKILTFNEILLWLKRAQATPEFHLSPRIRCNKVDVVRSARL